MKKAFITIQFLLLSLLFLPVSADIISPAPGDFIQSDICTISVDASKDLDSISFAISYYNENARRIKKHIATLTSSPYTIHYNVSDIPNQYYTGAEISGRYYRNDTLLRRSRVSNIYIFSKTLKEKSRFPFYQAAYTPEKTTRVSEDSTYEISAHSKHTENHFIASASVSALSKPENPLPDYAHFFIDYSAAQTPYVHEDVLHFRINLDDPSQKPHLISRTLAPDYSYEISSLPFDIPVEINRDDTTISTTLNIPTLFMGNTIPDSVGMNIIFSFPDTHIPDISLISGTEFAQKAPIAYPHWIKTEKNTLILSSQVLFILSLTGGIFAAGLLFIIQKRLRLRMAQKKGELLEKIVAHVDDNILRDDLTAESVARHFKVPKKLIPQALKITRDTNFQQYVLARRLEVAKERLVSSYSNEITIARDCNFQSIAEMEKVFRRYVGKAPYQYREHNSIDAPN
ncbi:MAG: helix-turn-helix domain-containing protein [Fibrobacterota bacterium]